MTKSTRALKKEESDNPALKALSFKTVITGASLAALLASSGCATSSLLEDNNRVSTTTTKSVLSEDQIVAFGRPAQALPKTPNATMVIVGEKNSYVLTQGGTEMVILLTNLTP